VSPTHISHGTPAGLPPSVADLIDGPLSTARPASASCCLGCRKVLAELADGTAPSTVARKLRVRYATVARIAETTKRLH
jgi:hypothetical protein